MEEGLQFGELRRPAGPGPHPVAIVIHAWDDATFLNKAKVTIRGAVTNAALLILVRPKALNDRQRYEVAKYLAGGGKVYIRNSEDYFGLLYGPPLGERANA